MDINEIFSNYEVDIVDISSGHYKIIEIDMNFVLLEKIIFNKNL